MSYIEANRSRALANYYKNHEANKAKNRENYYKRKALELEQRNQDIINKIGQPTIAPVAIAKPTPSSPPSIPKADTSYESIRDYIRNGGSTALLAADVREKFIDELTATVSSKYKHSGGYGFSLNASHQKPESKYYEYFTKGISNCGHKKSTVEIND